MVYRSIRAQANSHYTVHEVLSSNHDSKSMAIPSLWPPALMLRPSTRQREVELDSSTEALGVGHPNLSLVVHLACGCEGRGGSNRVWLRGAEIVCTY